MTATLGAETERFELRYVAAEDVLEMWVQGNERAMKDEAVEAAVKKDEAVIKGTKLTIDRQRNTAVIEGNAESVKWMQRLVKAVDVRPAQVKVKAVFVDVALEAGQENGLDVFGVKGWPAMLEGAEADLDALAEKAETSGRAEVRSRPEVFAANNKEANLSFGRSGGDSVTVKITPLINSADEVTLSLEAMLKVGEKPSQINTTMRLGDGNVAIVGGLVSTDAEGKRTETLLLFQPGMIEGE
jgi:hypothetical protein